MYIFATPPGKSYMYICIYDIYYSNYVWNILKYTFDGVYTNLKGSKIHASMDYFGMDGRIV